MSLLLSVLFIMIFGLIVAFLAPSGCWGNLIMFINVVTAALLATNFFEPVANWLSGMLPSGSYLWDLAAFWGVFAAVLMGMRLLTDLISQINVRFSKTVEMVGRYFFAAWTGWVVICMVAMSLHMAPLSREFMAGGFKAETPLFFGFSPDRMWLGFVQRESMNGLARGGSQTHYFDPQGEFMLRYMARREYFESHPGLGAATPGQSNAPQ
jgi:hypothetical protein